MSFVRQSASFAGIEPDSSAVLRRVSSRARRAASRACAATMPRWQSFFASAGLVSSHSPSASLTAALTKPSTSGLSSFSLGWLLNVGSGILTETIAIRPSRRSSPVGVGSFSLMIPAFRAYPFSVRVRLFLKPAPWVPPSTLLMLFAKVSTFSEYPSWYCRATSQIMLSASISRRM
jgi:hypothetical protein